MGHASFSGSSPCSVNPQTYSVSRQTSFHLHSSHPLLALNLQMKLPSSDSFFLSHLHCCFLSLKPSLKVLISFFDPPHFDFSNCKFFSPFLFFLMGNMKGLLNTSGELSEFRRKYHIPLDVQIWAPFPRESLDEGSGDAMPFPTIAIVDGSVLFHLDPFLVFFLSYANLSLLQCPPNLFWIIMGVAALNRLLGISLAVFDILSCYYLIPLNNQKSVF